MPSLLNEEDRQSLRGEHQADANPGQAAYDEQFKGLTSAEHLAQDGESGGNRRSVESRLGKAATGAEAQDSKPESSPPQSGKTSKNTSKQSLASRLGSRFKKRVGGLSGTKKILGGTGIGIALIGLIFGGFSLLGFLNVFRLDHFYKNIEARGFIRYQVDMEGRSSKWINAYITLRMGEVDDPNLAPENRQNILFRADRVDNNQPWFDWYRTMRASSFEDDLAKQGIRFTSSAVWDDARQRSVIRPGRITANGRESAPLVLSANRRAALDNIDPNGLNNDLLQYFDVELFGDESGVGGDRQARREIRSLIKDNTQWYQVMQRFYWRKSIQNQTGVRNWRFFETTREKVSNTTIETRNKFIVKSFPESAKSGKFVQCFFGIGDCPRGTDPNDSQNQSDSALAGLDCDSEPKPAGCVADVNSRDDTPGDGSAQVPSGTAEAGVRDGVNIGDAIIPDTGNAASAGAFTRVITQELIKKANIALGVVSLVDTVYNINKLINDDVLTTGVYNARAAQAIAAFATVGTAASQAHTGELTSEEMGGFMSLIDGAGTSEGWNTTIADDSPSVSGAASAASYEQARNKKESCSEAHQTAMLLPENQKQVASEYQWLCDSQKIGAANNGTTIQNAWKSSTGPIQPVLDLYGASGLDTVSQLVGDAINKITAPAINGAIKALGLNETIESAMAYIVTRAVSFLGGGPVLDTNSPSGQVTNQAIQGAAAASESIARFQGAAVTTTQARARNERAVAAYDENQDQSLFNRYASLANPSSMLSTNLFAVSLARPSTSFAGFFGSLISIPDKLLSTPAHAASETGYEVANFGGVETYDFPSACTNRNPLAPATPADMTNADELGLINASDLTWELINDNAAFYGKLYADNSDKGDAIKTAYDCALMDSAVRGSLGAKYGVDLGPNSLTSATQSDVAQPVAGTGAEATFTISTYNISQKIPSSSNAAAKVIFAADSPYKLDVIGTQELEGDAKYRTIQSAAEANGFGIYPDKKQGESLSRPGLNARTILYNTDTFTFVKASSFDYPRFPQDAGGKSGDEVIKAGRANAPIVWLQHKDGRVIIFINVHGVAFAENEERRYNADRIFVEQIQKLQASDPGTPIFLTGDFNEGTGVRSSGNTTYQRKSENLLYCMFAANKLMKSAEATAAGKDTVCPNPSIGDVDYIYTTPEVEVNTFSSIPAARAGTDHAVRYANVTIPGSQITGGGATSPDVSGGAWTWPIARNVYPGLSQCFEKPGHTGIDIPVPVSTAVYAAKGGTVIKTDPLGAGDGGKYIIIQTGSNEYTNYQHNSEIRVTQGQKVSSGQQISSSGNTGNSTGPHLHFSITTQNGLDSRSVVAYSVNPIPFLPKDRSTGSCQ